MLLDDLDRHPSADPSAGPSAPRGAWQDRARSEAVARYAAVADAGTVHDLFDAAVRSLGDVRVTDYLPVLVDRRLREVLGRAVPPQRA